MATAKAPSTLYFHPVSGNALGCLLYATEHKIECKSEFIDILAGKQFQEWYLEFNPFHCIPAYCDKDGNTIVESAAILLHLAELAGNKVSSLEHQALQYRNTLYPNFAKIYVGHLLGGDKAPIPDGVNGLKKLEENFINYFLKKKFIGGEKPGVADYHTVTVLTMMVGSPYWEHADERIKKYVEDFQTDVGCWGAVGKTQTDFVASKANSSDKVVLEEEKKA